MNETAPVIPTASGDGHGEREPSPPHARGVKQWVPFAGLNPRNAWLRGTLLVACLLGMVISYPVWLTTRSVPLLPIINGLPALPPPLDKCLFGAMLASLVLAFWLYRPAVTFFLAASFVAYCQDQNRGQPWLYMYWVMLVLTLCPESAALAACRLAISVIYIWGGIQKLQPAFFNRVPDWFVAPAGTNWHFPAPLVQSLSWLITCAPFFELFIGIGLWTTRWRKAAIVAALLVHATALLFLGPLGRNYNAVVWPWNVAMIVLIFALFGGAASDDQPQAASSVLSISTNLAALRKSGPSLIVVGLYGTLPLLSYVGLWDSYFSFTLYAENQAKADIFVTAAFANRLPPAMRTHVHKLQQEFNPDLQGPFVFDFQAWAFNELRVPPLMEPRNYLRIFKFLRSYSGDPADLRMIVSPRAGGMVFYQGDFRLLIGQPQEQQQ